MSHTSEHLRADPAEQDAVSTSSRAVDTDHTFVKLTMSTFERVSTGVLWRSELIFGVDTVYLKVLDQTAVQRCPRA